MCPCNAKQQQLLIKIVGSYRCLPRHGRVMCPCDSEVNLSTHVFQGWHYILRTSILGIGILLCLRFADHYYQTISPRKGSLVSDDPVSNHPR